MNNQANSNLIEQFNQFRAGFTGDPQAEVMKLLQSGRISQQQLDHVQNLARQLQNILK